MEHTEAFEASLGLTDGAKEAFEASLWLTDGAKEAFEASLGPPMDSGSASGEGLLKLNQELRIVADHWMNLTNKAQGLEVALVQERQ